MLATLSSIFDNEPIGVARSFCACDIVEAIMTNDLTSTKSMNAMTRLFAFRSANEEVREAGDEFGEGRGEDGGVDIVFCVVELGAGLGWRRRGGGGL